MRCRTASSSNSRRSSRHAEDPTPPTNEPGRRRFRLDLGLWLVLAFALALRLWTLDDKNLWLDESISLEFASGSVTHLIGETAKDMHPPLYFLLLKGWIALFGDSVTALRSMSVLAGVVAAFMTFRLAATSIGRSAALAVLVWLAVSPHAIYYSQEARMYAPATVAVLGACLAYRWWIDSAFKSRMALVAYTACVTAAWYLHYFTALAVIAIWLHALWLTRSRRVPWMAWGGTHVAVALLCAPWIMTAIAQITRGQPWWRHAVPLVDIPLQAADLFRHLTFGVYGVPLAGIVTVAVGLGIVGAGLFYLAVHISRKLDERDVFVALVGLGPIVLGLALLPFTGEMELSRYVAYASPLLVLAVARGLTVSGLPPARAIGVLLVGSVALLPALWTYYASPAKDSDTRPIVAFLNRAARWAPEGQDPIFVAPGYMTFALRAASRNGLEYRAVDAGVDLTNLLAEIPNGPRGAWLVVDYRWPGFKAIAGDGRVTEEPVPSPTAHKIKLYRVGAR